MRVLTHHSQISFQWINNVHSLRTVCNEACFLIHGVFTHVAPRRLSTGQSAPPVIDGFSNTTSTPRLIFAIKMPADRLALPLRVPVGLQTKYGKHVACTSFASRLLIALNSYLINPFAAFNTLQHTSCVVLACWEHTEKSWEVGLERTSQVIDNSWCYNLTQSVLQGVPENTCKLCAFNFDAVYETFDDGTVLNSN